MNSETVFRFFQRGWIALSAILVFALTGMTYAESDDPEVAHPREYEAAMATVLEGTTRIEGEMRHILRGDVAHYDFLQYEHIELIRHARALAHPPAALDQVAREQIAALADEVLEAANELEWIIADFLRAQALEEIREKNPETDIEGASPTSLLLRLDGAGVMEAASALQQRYKAASMSMSE